MGLHANDRGVRDASSLASPLRRVAVALVLGLGLALQPLIASAIDVIGTTTVNFEWTAASGPVSAYLVYVARNSDTFPTFPEAVTGASNRRVAIQGVYGERIRVRVAAVDASLLLGPWSPASDEVRFLAAPQSSVGEFDLDGNGQAELLVQHVSSAAISAWTLGAAVPVRTFPTSALASWTLEDSGDYDGDGRADLLWRDPAVPRLVLCRSTGTDANACTTYLAVGAGVMLTGLGDLDGDRRRDFLLRLPGSQVLVCRGAGLVPGTCASLGSYDATWRFSAAGDLDADGHADLLLRDTVTGRSVACRMFGLAVQSCALLTAAEFNFLMFGIGDVDGDGRGDLLFRYAALGLTLVCGTTTSGLGSCRTLSGIDSRWDFAGSGDYDGDKRPDLVWRDAAAGLVRVDLLSSVGFKAAPMLIPVGSAFRVLAR